MSKSKGNVIAPSEIIKTQGSEILRLWVALSHYQSDQNISDEILKQVGEQYRKIRNTIRFLLANAANNPQDLVMRDELGEIDRWILGECDRVFDEAYSYFDEYEFAKAFQGVMNFLTNELSGVYLDLCKDILYCDSANSLRRRSIQSAMVMILRRLLHFIAPVLTYTADEAFNHASNAIKAGCKDIFMLERSTCKESYNLATNIDFAYLLRVREKFGETLDSLKKQKILKSSLEVLLQVPQDIELLDRWLIVSGTQKAVQNGEELARFELAGNEFVLYRAQKGKCERCWQFVVENQADSKESALCERCAEVVRDL